MFFDVKIFDKTLDACFKGTSHIDLAKKSVVLGVVTSIFLVVIKFGAWKYTNSVSMLASMNDSILDALVSFLSFHALCFSSILYDKTHNFGHEKVEGLMALFQCLLVVYSGVVIFREAYASFVSSETAISNTNVAIIVMLVSCVAVYQLLYFQKYVAKKTDSVLVKGDSLHYLSDFLMNMCIIFSLALSSCFAYIDVVCGVIIGCYVMYNAFVIIKSALVDLMDESLPRKVQNQISKAILSIDGVLGIKILRTRSAGMKKYVESRVIINKDVTFIKAHYIALDVEKKIKTLFEKVDVIIRSEPEQQ